MHEALFWQQVSLFMSFIFWTQRSTWFEDVNSKLDSWRFCVSYFHDYQHDLLLYSHAILWAMLCCFLCYVMLYFFTSKLVLWSFTIIMCALKDCTLSENSKLSNKREMWWRSQNFFIWSIEKQIDMQRAWSFTSWTFFILCCLLYCLMCLLSLHHSFYA